MELLKGNGAPARAANLAVKQLTCSCGCNTFVAFPVGYVVYNALSPQQAEPQYFGAEFKCKNCGSFQCLKHEPGALPKWITMTAEEKEQTDKDAFKASMEKAKG